MKSLGLSLTALLEAALCIGLPSAASAADLGGAPRHRPVYDADTSPAIARGAYWGVTLGVEGGAADFKNVGKKNDSDLDSSSVGLGGVVGYNFVNGPWLWGVEADLTGTRFRDSASLDGLGTVTAKSDWFASLRLRGGYTWGNTLLYGTAGLAFSELDVKSSIKGHEHNLRTGLALGLGTEYAFDNNWTGRVEGLVYAFDDDVTLAGNMQDLSWGHSTIRLGLLRKF